MQTVQKVVVSLNDVIETISPYVHGQFAEHLGELVYPGVWVGEDSPIPNTKGIRNDVVEALKPLALPVLRWPGGCFADNYHWRDGIGPRKHRPMRVNVHWGMAPEPNHFGTHEFIDFCRMIGAEPYLAANVGSGSPLEFQEWVEYCNFAGRSALADQRRANSAKDPFKVQFWGVGNENWGCGGNMNPEQYADEFCRFRTYLFNYPGQSTFAVAAGAAGTDGPWTARFFERLARNYWDRRGMVQGFAAHYYCGTAGKSATEYNEQDWIELLAKAHFMENIILGQRAIMDVYDPARKVKLLVDEWGAWHPIEPGKPAGGLYQQNTIRDACVAALTLDVFHNHADKVYMCNIAQLINVLQSLLLVEGDRCIKTPTYHVFDLYRPHRGAQAVRLVSCAQEIHNNSQEAAKTAWSPSRHSLQAVHGSASVKDGVLCVTACNTHPTTPVELELEIHGGKLPAAKVVRLATKDIHAHNTFDRADEVKLSRAQNVQAKGRFLRIEMPPGSVIRVMGPLA